MIKAQIDTTLSTWVQTSGPDLLNQNVGHQQHAGFLEIIEQIRVIY